MRKMRWLGPGAALLFGALMLSACVEHYGAHIGLRADDRVRAEDWPDPTRDPTEARPVQPDTLP